MLDGSSPPLLALCDFGVSRHFSKKRNVSMHTIAGTPGFIAPDVLGQMFVRGATSGYDGRAADVWSAGAVLCKLLTGHLPFGFEHELQATWDTKAAMHRVWAAARQSNARSFLEHEPAVSEGALNALDAMLHMDQAARPTAADCLALPWVATAPLPARYEAALSAAQERQAAIEAEHAADPPRRLGRTKTAPGDWRDSHMRAFVARAVTAGHLGEPVESHSLLPSNELSSRSPRASDSVTGEEAAVAVAAAA